MRNRITSLFATVVLIIAFIPTPVNAQPTHETIYTVWWDGGCPVGPPVADHIVGEWTSTCNGGWYGYGWQPGQYSCSYTVVSQGEPC